LIITPLYFSFYLPVEFDGDFPDLRENQFTVLELEARLVVIQGFEPPNALVPKPSDLPPVPGVTFS
jgi:hypothetical protein